MTWYHLVDETGTHYVIPASVSPVSYFRSQAVDGSQPIYMYLVNGLVFTITPALFASIVGAVPAAVQVTV